MKEMRINVEKKNWDGEQKFVFNLFLNREKETEKMGNNKKNGNGSLSIKYTFHPYPQFLFLSLSFS
jgi:hypothetical protein